MFGRFLVWISHLLCEFIMPCTPTCRTPSNAMPCTTDSQSQLTFVSSSTPTKYDVFLSFRGTDTRLNFTGHLYDKLVCSGIQTFMDDPELRSGQVIADALLDAIRESKTYIVVLSENYAFSRWCLDELVEIFNCHKTAQRLVIPVFYKIHPFVVRHQIGKFNEAFNKHRGRVKMEKVNKWRLALSRLAGLSGFHISENTSEADINNQILDEILPKLNSKVLDVPQYQVGLDSRVKVITELLNSGTKQGFTKIGLYGMGGVGKTTLAKALFNRLLSIGSFKGSCFLANVREASRTFKGMAPLQQIFINDVLKSKKDITVANEDEGKRLIKERIRSTKLLFLIDDIDDPRQYESLVGSFASGSVVITTTRDQEILDRIEVEPKFQYKVNELDDAESLVLFTRHAFRNAEQNNTLMVLSADILRHADGLPLALEVFGSYLYKKPEVGWKSYIDKLQRVPDNSIQQKLIISLNAIELEDPMLKKIFLDIACFFIGWHKEEVVTILETYYYSAAHKIEILQKRCLVKIYEHELDMHDLLRDMGREIVRNISPDEPGRQSRLWVSEDIYHVLKKETGTEAIEGIIHHKKNPSAIEGKSFSIVTSETFSTKAFKKMSKLRFLFLPFVNLTGSFEQTLEDLRWFGWECCPLECLPSEFYPQKLVILELPDSNMKTMWKPNMVSHVFGKLKSLNMSGSGKLSTTSDFSRVPCLETLNLQGCVRLEEIHMSIGTLVSLVSLNLGFCMELKSLPNTICDLRALKVLNLHYCISLQVLPTELGNIESLTTLFASGLWVSELPESIGSLTKLVELHLNGNYRLETLPDTICNLRSLEILNISGCHELEILPDQLWKITRLRKLYARSATGLKKLPDIESSQIGLSLQVLDLSKSGITALPSGLSQLSNLKEFDLEGCYDLFSIPKLPPNLKRIKANGCSSLERLPNLSNLKHLETLNLDLCGRLTEIRGLEELTALRDFDLSGCIGMINIEGLTKLTSIHSLVAPRHLPKPLFQVYSEFGQRVFVGYSAHRASNWPDWMIESPYWTSESSESESTIVYAHLLPNQSHNFMGIILCFKGPISSYFGFSVKNTTSGFIWSDSHPDLSRGELLMVIVPKSIFSITDDDHRIEFTAGNVKIAGIHLLYKTETKMIDDVVKEYCINVNELKLIDPVLQDIFLDIACFFIGWEKEEFSFLDGIRRVFIGWKKEEVVSILETYYSDVDDAIDILMKRCLLTINGSDELEMNHELQLIGRKIANDSPDEPGRYSRLWLSSDIYDVLKKQEGTEANQGIIPRRLAPYAFEGESFTTETFKRMSNLRFLYLNKVNFTGSFEQIFEDLRWLCWDYCPLKCLPSEFHPQKLVTLELLHSEMRTMWEQNMVSHVFEKLTTLNMNYSLHLTTTPDFTRLPCLETLNLKACESLEEIHTSIGSLVRLVSLDLHGCVKLRRLPDTICNLTALKDLSIGQCSNLEALPMEFGDIESLAKLNAYGLTVSKLPNSIRRLSKLVELRLSSNKNLETLPDTICNLRSLEILDISGCEKLEISVDQLCKVTSLRELIAGGATLLKFFPHVESSQFALSLQNLDLSESVLTALPPGISQLSNLEDLNLKDCRCLLSIAELPPNLKRIKAQGCTSIERLPNLSNLKQLEYLNLEDCSGLTEIPGLKGLTSIRRLHLEGCNSSLCANIFTESFFQMYCEYGHPIQIISAEFPDWISQSSEWWSTMSSELPSNVSLDTTNFLNEDGSTISLNLPPNESHNYLGMIVCIRFPIIQITSTCDLICRQESGHKSSMGIVPKIFSVKDGDVKFNFTKHKNGRILGIRLLYKTEDYDKTTVNED